MQPCIERHIRRHIEVFEHVFLPMAPQIERCALLLCRSFRAGGKVLVMGNGGSAADAQHLAAELVGRFMKNRAALPAVALTTDTSVITAVANDFGYDEVFRRQVEALARPEDVVIGISTSGNSTNVLRALELARASGCSVVTLSGRDGGKMAAFADLCLNVAVEETPRIQEVHLSIIHILCDLVEQQMFPEQGEI
ncbi:MAG: D-sedoheptulose 7-phosphate isomerase [Desulfuromonadaceae bacterium]|nr:D-sedoheptulose 7-phosphate isomerase [Desulfuromonadaceae bacterium]